MADSSASEHHNNLTNEKSPYLLQHAKNPVDWYPWGEVAFEKARTEDKPIFLSIGYSTCHWCHVMEHESFEDSAVAERMNELFVSVKVDREERPDIDNIYMTVCQMLTGSGGWPLTIIMTPDKKPFFAGTYLPKNSMGGRIGMLDLMTKVGDFWTNDRNKILSSAQQITQKLQSQISEVPGPALGINVLNTAYNQYKTNFDSNMGGFGSSPKFPTPHNLMFLLRHWKRSGDEQALFMVEKTLREMRKGGMYDQIGFGFHRYSTDARWFLPHFEKMLYDQAMLAMIYIEAYQATGKEEYKQTATEIFEYVKRDMTDSQGGFYSAEDADSEGEEGKFYLFSKTEIQEIIGSDDSEMFCDLFNITATGNYAEEATGHKTGTNILHLTSTHKVMAEKYSLTETDLLEKVDKYRNKIFKVREKRIHPYKDDKILTDWNGLMIAAFAMGGRVFNDSELTKTAQTAMQFIIDKMLQNDGSLLHRYREGEAIQTGFVEDYAFLIWGQWELYQTTFDIKYLKQSLELNNYLIEHFWDDQHGGFFFTSDSGEQLIHRQKEIYDGAIPSGNSVAALNLIRLARVMADPKLEELSRQIGQTFSQQISQHPSAYGMLMHAVDFQVGPSFEIVITGEYKKDDTQAMFAALNSQFIPNKVEVFRPANEDSPEIIKYAEYAKHQLATDNKATAYVCQNFACSLPTTMVEDMLEKIQSAYSSK